MARTTRHLGTVATILRLLSHYPSAPPNSCPMIDKIDNAAIDHHDNGGIYVTNYSVNFLMEIDEKRKLIFMYSYWNTAPEADEIDILRFVNQANTQKIMLQFSYNAGLGRLYAHYTHPYHVGLLPPHVLKLCQKFSSIFEDVLHEGIADGVLQELPECPVDGNDVGMAEGTIH